MPQIGTGVSFISDLFCVTDPGHCHIISSNSGQYFGQPNQSSIGFFGATTTTGTATTWVNPTIFNVATTANTITATAAFTNSLVSNGNAIANCYAGLLIIDEDDYMNHQEYFELARQRGIAFRIRTAEEKRLHAEAVARARAEQEQREAKRNAGEVKARGLLLENLTAKQRETFEKHGWFIVVGGKTKTEYRIRTVGVAGNIDVLNKKGEAIARLCRHCSNYEIPRHDQHLAQKLSLQYDEENFVKHANRHAA